jgi:hypothetical protein
MLKANQILFNRDTGRAERNAKEALEAARETLSDLKAQKEPTPQCARCKQRVHLPCWFCVDCTGKFRRKNMFSLIPLLTFVPTEERFICDDCEYRCLTFNDVHTKKHILVRVVEKVVETVVSTEDRLRAVEGQLESVQDRLEKMEALLSRLLERGPSETLAGPDGQAAIVRLTNPDSSNQEMPAAPTTGTEK